VRKKEGGKAFYLFFTILLLFILIFVLGVMTTTCVLPMRAATPLAGALSLL
jgi:hypothetical protein